MGREAGAYYQWGRSGGALTPALHRWPGSIIFNFVQCCQWGAEPAGALKVPPPTPCVRAGLTAHNVPAPSHRFGIMSAQMKALFDSTGQLWQKGQLVGKPAAFFT